MREHGNNSATEIEERKKIISDTADEVLELLLRKKMSYADTCEVLHIAQILIEEFTYPVCVNSKNESQVINI